MAEQKEIVLINKGKGRFTINFQGAFLNKSAVRGGKFYLNEKEYDFVKATYPHILEGETKRLFLEGEEAEKNIEVNRDEDLKAFFAQHHTKVKSAIAQMDTEEAQVKLNYAQLNEVSEGTIKVLEDRILELDKQGE